MKRRTFLATTAMTLVSAASAVCVLPFRSDSAAWVSRTFIRSGSALGIGDLPLSVTARAERLSRWEAAKLPTTDDILESLGFGHDSFLERNVMNVGEVVPTQEIDLPTRFVTFTVVEGAAAVETEFFVGVMQRDRIRWTLTAVEGDTSVRMRVLTDLAVALSEREILTDEVTQDADGLHSGDLWDLLPTADDLPPEFTHHRDTTSEDPDA